MQNAFETYPYLLTVPMVAEILGVTEITVRKLIKSKDLEAIKVGKLIKVPKECLFRYLTNYV